MNFALSTRLYPIQSMDSPGAIIETASDGFNEDFDLEDAILEPFDEPKPDLNDNVYEKFH